jgi:hypothetical protein
MPGTMPLFANSVKPRACCVAPDSSSASFALFRRGRLLFSCRFRLERADLPLSDKRRRGARAPEVMSLQGCAGPIRAEETTIIALCCRLLVSFCLTLGLFLLRCPA